MVDFSKHIKFKPSAQQKDIFRWVENDDGNALIEAVAGSGKTTTLVQSLKYMDGKIAMVSFSKRIVEHLERLTIRYDNVTVKTFHSFGFEALRQNVEGIRVDDEKANTAAEMCKVPWHLRSFVRKLVSIIKNSAISVENADYGTLRNIVDWYSIDLEINPDQFSNPNPETMQARLDELIADGIEYAKETFYAHVELLETTGSIDYDDMIAMPLYFGLKFKRYDWVLGDEFQDASLGRRRIARRIKKRDGRILLAADRHQSIMGFSGAETNSVEESIKLFECTTFPLSVSYRCPKKVVLRARDYNDVITSHPDAIEGIYETTEKAYLHGTAGMNLVKGDAIICRYTKPLVALAYDLIRLGVPCYIAGKDIGKNLIKLISRWRRLATTEQLEQKLEDYKKERMEHFAKSKQQAKIENLVDQIETIKIVIAQCGTRDSIQVLVAKIEQLFQDSGNSVVLSTIHKAKGLEFKRVYWYGSMEFATPKYAKKDWEKDQNRNLCYVAITRAKEELYEVPLTLMK